MSFPEICVRGCARLLILVSIPLLALPSCKPNHDAPKNAYKVVRVDNHPGNPKTADYRDINAAISSATQDAHIVCAAGTYVVDNPLVMKRNGVRVIGSGREETILVPRNVGKPIFVFQADHLGVEDIGMNARTEDRKGRATFAILIEEGYGNCEIRNTKIQNAGASSLIGYSADDCLVTNNVIINSGDDGIKMRGHRLRILNNILIRYFDEGIDVGTGENIIVGNNISSMGRIGIVVDDSTDALIFGNFVEDQSQEGIVLGSKRRGIVENNTISNGFGIAFNLHSPGVVKSNFVAGQHSVGFRIRSMNNGIIQQNVIINAGLGIDISAGKRNLIYANEYFGTGKWINVEESGGNTIYGNDNYNDDESYVRKNSEVIGTRIPNGLKREQVELYEQYRVSLAPLPQTSSHSVSAFAGDNVVVKGQSQRDRKQAETIADFLKRNNPGYLSVEVHGNNMKSDITEDLYNSLRGGNQLAAGLVRIPFLRFKRGTGSYFPLWRLFVGGKEVAIVSPKRTGPKVQIYFLEEGWLNWQDTFSMWKNRLIAGIVVVKDRLINRIS